jgi:hypothetical protein
MPRSKPGQVAVLPHYATSVLIFDVGGDRIVVYVLINVGDGFIFVVYALIFDVHALMNDVYELIFGDYELIFYVYEFIFVVYELFLDVYALLDGVRGLFFTVRGLSDDEIVLSNVVREFSDDEKESLVGV